MLGVDNGVLEGSALSILVRFAKGTDDGELLAAVGISVGALLGCIDGPTNGLLDRGMRLGNSLGKGDGMSDG